jgi:hypothetical protein
MEGTQSRTRRREARSTTKRGLIVELWDRLGRPGVGERELDEIQRSLRKHFGSGADESPAGIARVLADEGADLRHPEVIEFDARWREARIESDGAAFKGLEELLTGRPVQLRKADALIKKLEKLRLSLSESGNQSAAKRARDLAASARRTAELLANDRTLNPAERAEQSEIAEWLKVWLQTPSLFADWLELRRRSPEFMEKFSETGVGL